MVRVMVTVELFYSPICPHCPKAKETLMEVLEEVKGEIELQMVNVLSKKGIEKAKEYGIMTVPAIVVNRKHKILGTPIKNVLLRVLSRENLAERTQI